MTTRRRLLIAACVAVLLIPVSAAAQPPAAVAAFNDGVAHHTAGRFAEAAAAFDRAATLGYQPVNQARLRQARALARLGRGDDALAILERLAAGGFANTPALATTDLDSVRAHPRYIAAAARIDANAHPCAADPRFHEFDFWIGEWDVQPSGAPRAPIGQGATSVIERQLDGCVIQENWQPIGGVGAGKSFNIFNSVTGQWEQYYVDTRGTITHYRGTFKDGALVYLADQFASPNKLRMTFFNKGPNEVRQFGETSTDGGATWTTTFDLTYVRKPPKTSS
jgi:hypothetical protein